jgi:hypothetical protein
MAPIRTRTRGNRQPTFKLYSNGEIGVRMIKLAEDYGGILPGIMQVNVRMEPHDGYVDVRFHLSEFEMAPRPKGDEE